MHVEIDSFHEQEQPCVTRARLSRRRCFALAVAALCRLLPLALVASPSAAASLFEPGDVIVAGVTGGFGTVGAVRVFRADGTLRGELSLGGLGEVRFAPDGLLAVLNGNEIMFVTPDGGVAKRINIPRGYGADPARAVVDLRPELVAEGMRSVRSGCANKRTGTLPVAGSTGRSSTSALA